MGVIVMYHLKLRIQSRDFQRALEIFNHLHSDEMLEKHADGGSYGGASKTLPIRKRKWYSWVNNPKQPYTDLKEAFENWCLVDEDVKYYVDDSGNFVAEGSYSNKLGQQYFLIEQLAPVLEDTEIRVSGDDGYTLYWTVKNHVFKEVVKSFEEEYKSDRG